MKKKTNIKEFFKDLLNSIIKTKNLFKFSLYSWITPLIIFIVTCGVISIPTIVSFNSIKVSDITSNVLYLDQVIAHALSNDVKCNINDSKLICDEGYSYEELYEFENNDNTKVKYKIYVNADISNVNFNVGKFGQRFDTDNYIIFFESSFAYRYTYHDPRTESVQEYALYGFYDNLNGTNLSTIYTDSLTHGENAINAFSNEVTTYMNTNNVSSEVATQTLLTEKGFTTINELKEKAINDYLLDESNTIIYQGYKALASQTIYNGILANVAMYLMFILISALLFKGNFLLKKNKGFKYSQGIKLALVSSLQSLIIALVLYLIGMDLMNALGLAMTVRILYIYCRYTGSKKNTQWLDDLYEFSGNERFKVDYSNIKLTDPFGNKDLGNCPNCNHKLKMKNDVVYCPKCDSNKKKDKKLDIKKCPNCGAKLSVNEDKAHCNYCNEDFDLK